MSFTGELGYEVHCVSEYSEHVYNSIFKAGEKYGITNAGYRALGSLSLEAGND